MMKNNSCFTSYRFNLIALTIVLGLTACSSSKTDPPPRSDIPKGLLDLPFLQAGWSSSHGDAKPGKLHEVIREKRAGIKTDDLNMLPVVKDEEKELEVLNSERVAKVAALTGTLEFEFFDLASSRYFGYSVSRAELAKASRYISQFPDENKTEGKPPTREEIKREDDVKKSWSNSNDSRIRRAIADGFSDTGFYQRFADYGGCSATVLSATSTRMVAITAAHCIYSGNNFSIAKLRPRRNGGTSPTWGSWTAYAFGYYPAYLNNDCENNWSGSKCIKHDIALVIASPDAGASPPRGMGWGYRPKSFLNDHSKYRRGYPGCSYSHSPSSCTTNNLYGDGRMSVGRFSKLDGDGWNRQIRFSSDINPGDSGSGLYYYRNGNPYVFAVTSAEPSGCKTNCSSSRPNYARRITPQFYDFINSVI